MKNKTPKLDKKHNWELFLNFLFFIAPLDLTIEETKLLIWRFYNKETYQKCAELLGPSKWNKRKSRQGAEGKIKNILIKIKKQAKHKQNNPLLEYVSHHYNYN